MKRPSLGLLVAVAAALSMHALVSAQQGGSNISICRHRPIH
jgi:hypothetical protein